MRGIGKKGRGGQEGRVGEREGGKGTREAGTRNEFRK
jgi:hypothetical protein